MKHQNPPEEIDDTKRRTHVRKERMEVKEMKIITLVPYLSCQPLDPWRVRLPVGDKIQAQSGLVGISHKGPYSILVEACSKRQSSSSHVIILLNSE